MRHEDTDGYGWCTFGTRNGLECFCGDEACMSFEERTEDAEESHLD